jgi:hypothetical protein
MDINIIVGVWVNRTWYTVGNVSWEKIKERIYVLSKNKKNFKVIICMMTLGQNKDIYFKLCYCDLKHIFAGLVEICFKILLARICFIIVYISEV